MIDQVAALNQASLGLPADHTFYDSGNDRTGVDVFSGDCDYDRCYADIKQLEGEILKHALALQGADLDQDESVRLGQVIPSIRNGVHAAKSMKDINDDLRLFHDSVNDRFNAYYNQFREAEREFYEALSSLRAADVPTHRFETLVEIKNKSEDIARRMHKRILREVSRGELSEVEISTLLNVNRELSTSHHSLLSALADALLDMESAADFASIPSMR